ncbi:hypothetical protein UREOM_2370 [Ureaplasma sp. OM1]|uniref:Bifunctional preprotein translocase subunit SecD/SecF n=2 Tax=Ureaplasma ceti TaxID=3119530 RepID=A0ABP9U8T5_9BACT
MIVACLCGIGFGANHFARTGTKNKGNQYTNSLQSVVQVELDQNKTDAQNLKVIQDIANKVTNEVKLMGANQIQVESGLQKNTNIISTSGKPTAYGSVYVYTEQNLKGFPLDFNNNQQDVQKNTLFEQKLKLYYALANSNNMQLENFSALNSKANDKTNKDTLENFKTNYNLVSDKNKAFSKDGLIQFKLPETTTKAKKWNLSEFQKQFTNQFAWDGKTNRNDVVAKANGTMLAAPKDQYILWNNRTGLINRLEIDATIGTLNKNYSGLNANQVIAVRSMFNALSPEDQNFAEWAGAVTSSTSYQSVMSALTSANQNNYGLSKDSQTNVETDPLLNLLNQYYTSNTYNETVGVTQQPNKVKFTTPYQWLYSWNFKNLPMLSGYFVPIDYDNFFTFFNDNSDFKKTDIKQIKSEYYSNSFSLPIIGKSAPEIADILNNINNSSFTQPIINEAIISPYYQGENNNNASKIYEGLNAFASNFISLYNNKSTKSVTTLDAFNGTLVGLSVLILLIGIVVSIIYRVPGALNFLTAALTFGLTLAMFASLQMLFSVDTYLALFTSIIASFVPFLISQTDFKRAIRDKKLNLLNSFIYSIKSFLRNAITIYIAMLIVALVFMFFGQYQIKGFGSMLVLASFANIISSATIYLLLYSTIYWLANKHSPQIFVTKKYQTILHEIGTTTFGEGEVAPTAQSLLDKALDRLVLGFTRQKWWVWFIFAIVLALGIIGCILLGTIGPGYSFAFRSSSEIVLTWSPTNGTTSADISSLKAQIAQHFNITWVNNSGLNAAGNYQEVGYAKNSLNIEKFYSWFEQNYPQSALLNNISFRSTSDYMPWLLFNNSLKCMFISIGFLAIWSILALNVVNFIPVFIISCLANLAAFGIVGIIRVPVDNSSISTACCIFAFTQILIYAVYGSIKFQFNMKTRKTLKEMLEFVVQAVKSMFSVYSFIVVAFFLSSLIMMIFTSTNFVYNQVILFVNSLVVYAIIIVLSPTAFGLAMMLRELYLGKVVTNKKLRIKHKEYDKVDEQEIYGINHR